MLDPNLIGTWKVLSVKVYSGDDDRDSSKGINHGGLLGITPAGYAFYGHNKLDDAVWPESMAEDLFYAASIEQESPGAFVEKFIFSNQPQRLGQSRSVAYEIHGNILRLRSTSPSGFKVEAELDRQ